MNFLAHLFLSGEDEELMIGNFIADFIRNRDVKLYAQRIRDGIYLHRQIDSFTDNHPIVRQGTQRLRPYHGKYAPVVLDVLFDYLLANNWDRYSDVPIAEYTKKVYGILSKHRHVLPPKIAGRLPEMIADNWLVKYGWEDGLNDVFRRMKRRVSKPDLLNNAVLNFKKDYEAYENEFITFFPDVIAHANAIH